VREERGRSFRRINLVEVINNPEKGKKTSKLNLVDVLRFSDTTTKLIEYNREKGILFLLNKAKPEHSLRLFTVKLKGYSNLDFSESEGENDKDNKMKFEFVTEARLKLNNMALSAI